MKNRPAGRRPASLNQHRAPRERTATPATHQIRRSSKAPDAPIRPAGRRDQAQDPESASIRRRGNQSLCNKDSWAESYGPDASPRPRIASLAATLRTPWRSSSPGLSRAAGALDARPHAESGRVSVRVVYLGVTAGPATRPNVRPPGLSNLPGRNLTVRCQLHACPFLSPVCLI